MKLMPFGMRAFWEVEGNDAVTLLLSGWERSRSVPNSLPLVVSALVVSKEM
jgi:hypothetical protein